MLSEVILEVALMVGNTYTGKGALGQWRASDRQHHLDTEPGLW